MTPAVQELETQTVDVETLHTYYRNPRHGNIDAVAASLQRNGQYRAIVVNKGTHTGRPMEVLAGNHTLKAARKLGWATITAHIIDVDDDQATRIVVADNRTSDLATNDDEMIAELLQGLDDLEGTGYTLEELEELTAPDDDPIDSGVEDEYRERFEVVVECGSEEHQERIFQKLTEEGETCRLLTL